MDYILMPITYNLSLTKSLILRICNEQAHHVLIFTTLMLSHSFPLHSSPRSSSMNSSHHSVPVASPQQQQHVNFAGMFHFMRLTNLLLSNNDNFPPVSRASCAHLTSADSPLSRCSLFGEHGSGYMAFGICELSKTDFQQVQYAMQSCKIL